MDSVDDTTQNYVEWKAVEEGFHLLERDLSKLQVLSLTLGADCIDTYLDASTL
jgi:hypothetical protein